MKITEEGLHVGTLLGGIEQVRQALEDAGFDPDRTKIEIRLENATEEQMVEIATILRQTERMLWIRPGEVKGHVHLEDKDNGYLITNARASRINMKLINKLPEFCYGCLPSNKEVIKINRGEMGYSKFCEGMYQGEENARILNEELGVTPAQQKAMEMGSLAGWDIRAADPDTYDENGRFKR